MFIFVDTDCERQAFVSDDPIFEGINGYQFDTTFVTEGIFKHMKEAMLDKDPSLAPLKRVKYCSEECEEMSAFMYEFTACMKECNGGEKAEAVAVVIIE